MSKKWLKTILAFLFLCASLSYLWFGDTFVRQMRRMRMAEAHLPMLTNQIALHPKLREVHFGRGTGAGGCIMALGEVRTEADLRDLKVAVDATKPPVVVLYIVRVLEQNE
jgi:hypothetical protein